MIELDDIIHYTALHEPDRHGGSNIFGKLEPLMGVVLLSGVGIEYFQILYCEHFEINEIMLGFYNSCSLCLV